MNTHTIGTLLAAGALAYIVYALWTDWMRMQRMRSLDAFYRQRETQVDDAPRASREYQVRLLFERFGMDVRGSESEAVYSAYLAGALVVWLLLLPLGLGFVGLAGSGVLSYFLVESAISSRWDRVRREMEQDIPTMMRNMAGFLQAGGSALQVLGETVRALEESSPLRAWLQRWVRELQVNGAQVLPDMRAEAQEISSALVLVVFEIERLWETGGSGYAHAFQSSAENLAELIAVRAQAQAKASGAYGLARLLIVTSAFTLGYMMFNPGSRAMFMESVFVKVGLLVAVGWGAFGWRVIREVVQEATE